MASCDNMPPTKRARDRMDEGAPRAKKGRKCQTEALIIKVNDMQIYRNDAQWISYKFQYGTLVLMLRVVAINGFVVAYMCANKAGNGDLFLLGAPEVTMFVLSVVVNNEPTNINEFGDSGSMGKAALAATRAISAVRLAALQREDEGAADPFAFVGAAVLTRRQQVYGGDREKEMESMTENTMHAPVATFGGAPALFGASCAKRITTSPLGSFIGSINEISDELEGADEDTVDEAIDSVADLLRAHVHDLQKEDRGFCHRITSRGDDAVARVYPVLKATVAPPDAVAKNRSIYSFMRALHDACLWEAVVPGLPYAKDAMDAVAAACPAPTRKTRKPRKAAAETEEFTETMDEAPMIKTEMEEHDAVAARAYAQALALDQQRAAYEKDAASAALLDVDGDLPEIKEEEVDERGLATSAFAAAAAAMEGGDNDWALLDEF